MAQGNNPTRNETAGLDHLGQLSQLPTEVRLIIWDALLFCSRENTPKSIFAVSRCNLNRYLYNEVSFYVYQQISHAIVLRPTHRADWEVKISFGKLQHEWAFIQEITLQRYIDAFFHAKRSYGRPQIQVDIHPTSSMDRSRIRCLWRKADELTKTLKQSCRGNSHQVQPLVYVNLVGDWVLDGKPRQSGKDRLEYGDILIRWIRIKPPDHDIAALFFLQFEASFNLPQQLRELISHEPEGKPHSILYKFLSGPRTRNGSGQLQVISFDQKEFQKSLYHIDEWVTFGWGWLDLDERREWRSYDRHEDKPGHSHYNEDGWESEDQYANTTRKKFNHCLLYGAEDLPARQRSPPMSD